MIIYAETDERLTYNQLNDQSNQLAHYFLSLGYSKGDAVAIFMENHPKYMVCLMALAKIGVVASLINTHLTEEVFGLLKTEEKKIRLALKLTINEKSTIFVQFF